MTDRRPHYTDDAVTVWHGDCMDVLRELPDESIDAVVTDPPYGLEFMGREWDKFRLDDPGTTRHRGERAGQHGDTDRTRDRYGSVAYGAGARPTTSRCSGCGRRDQFRKAHECAPGAEWRTELIRDDGPPPSSAAFGEWCRVWARECLRVLKPGGHLLAFGGSRTWHRLTAGIEDAGFDIRDSIAWLYGSGFPKSLDVSRAIDKAAGAEREDVYEDTAKVTTNTVLGKGLGVALVERRPATPDAAAWQGWGTALKPAFEPIVVARKPLTGTVAANVLTHGTGALNVDACRVEHASDADLAASLAKNPGRTDTVTSGTYGADRPQQSVNPAGRWPTNVVLDQHTAAELDQQSGVQRDGVAVKRNGVSSNGVTGWGKAEPGTPDVGYGGEGGASRFFPVFRYEAKAPTSERPTYAVASGEEGRVMNASSKTRECNICGNRTNPAGGTHSGKPWPACGHEDWSWVEKKSQEGRVAHPTVKPLDLMRWLVRLVTPPGGTVLDPFAGSGTTAEACVIEGFRCVTIEREADYLPLIVARLTKPLEPVLDLGNL